MNAVANGDLEKLKNIITKNPELITEDFCQDLDASESCDSTERKINVLDLAVKSRQSHVLSLLISEGLCYNSESFLNFLTKSEFQFSTDILNEVIKHDSRAGVALINKSINLSNENSVSLDFKVLTTPVTETVLIHGCQGISEHPLCESQNLINWQSNRLIAFTFLLMNLLHSLVLSSAVITQNYTKSSTNSDIFMVLLSVSLFIYLPILSFNLLLVVNTARGLLLKFKIFLQSVHLALLLIYIILSFIGVLSNFSLHIRTWAALSAWIQVLICLHDLPETSFYVELFINVIKDLFKFITIFISILIGFSVSLHTIIPKHDNTFKSPVNTFLKILSFSAGDINFNSTFLEEIVWGHGTVQIIFILVFFTINIVMINIMIGLTITSIHDTIQTREQMKFVRTMFYNYKLERIRLMLKERLRRCRLSKYRCCWKLIEGSPLKEAILKMNNKPRNAFKKNLLERACDGNFKIQKDFGKLIN